jgi:hypothetical protein
MREVILPDGRAHIKKNETALDCISGVIFDEVEEVFRVCDAEVADRSDSFFVARF